MHGHGYAYLVMMSCGILLISLEHPHLRPKIAERNEYKGANGARGDFKGISPELYERLKKMGLTDEEIGKSMCSGVGCREKRETWLWG